MKYARPIEPGVLSAFRLFTGVRLALLACAAAVEFFVNGWPLTPPWFYLITIFDALILLGYLSWSWLAGRLKNWYLPVGIVLAAVLPTLEPKILFRFLPPSELPAMALNNAWQSILVLLIPLFIIGWQYTFRTVIVYTLAITLTDMLPVIILRHLGVVNRLALAMAGVVLIRLVIFLFLGYMIVRLMSTQRGLRAELTSANTRLAQYAGTLEQLTISRERNRLARELHDVLAHTLSEVAVELEAVKALWESRPSQAQSMLDHSLHTTRSGLTETRRALQALRASPLEDLGLALAVRSLAENAAERSGLRLETQIAENLPELPPDVEHCFYRVAQEALTNIADHAGAQGVSVQLQMQGVGVSLLVSDDGKGFDQAGIDSREQFGLDGMRERAEAIGGKLVIQSRPGGGTSVSLEYGGAS